jgi:hypothetical protein
MLSSLQNTSPKLQPLSPPVQLSTIHHERKNIYVAREDMLPGGTKQRAIARFAELMLAKGFNHFVYAGPFCGYAQVALAYVCQIMELPCTIVAERDPHARNESGKHAYTELAEKYGAQIVLENSLAEATRTATTFCAQHAKRLNVPLGFDCVEYKNLLQAELEIQWQNILSALPETPNYLWLPVGSGTLAQTFSRFIESSTRIRCVNVHVLSGQDTRIQALRDNCNIELFSSPQVFAESACRKPCIPSNEFYDAKLWHFIAQHGQDGDLWWNVGR